MSAPKHPSRRDFLQKMAATTVITSTGLGTSQKVIEIPRAALPNPVSPNDQIRIATIGMGIIGFVDTETALRVPGVELVAVSDVYEGRRIHAQEVFGKHVDTYVDYREILSRDDIDAVLICTPDHWHATMAKDAMRAGKAVYLEKPMIKDVAEGPDVIRVQKETGQVLQVGSQFASSILYAKARELYLAGEIGELNMIEAVTNRNSPIGAWQYSIPTDASPETIDWDRFLGNAPKRDFDPVRFFRWRNYWDYGTATAGDLYVHLFTGIHRTLDAIGPTHIVSQGGLRYWNDGRDVPDVLLGLFTYPETASHPAFNMALQTNFADGRGSEFSFRFIGNEGVITIGWTSLSLTRRGVSMPSVSDVLRGYNSVRTFSNAQQAEFAKAYRASLETGVAPSMNAESTYEVPEGYDERFDHFSYFFDSVRNGTPVYEDATFGYRAAAPTLLCNMSYVNGQSYDWNPESMQVV